MSIIRLVHTKIAPEKGAEAMTNWRQDCGPLMLRQKGCVSEQLLRDCADAGVFVSYSEWESQADVDAYLKGADHQEIKRHNLKLGPAEVRVQTLERVL